MQIGPTLKFVFSIAINKFGLLDLPLQEARLVFYINNTVTIFF
jgi:hypothetical protein